MKHVSSASGLRGKSVTKVLLYCFYSDIALLEMRRVTSIHHFFSPPSLLIDNRLEIIVEI